MSFFVEKLTNEPIIISTMAHDFNPREEGEAFWAELGALVEREGGPVYRITVVEGEGNFSDMVYIIAEEAKSGRPGSSADPRIRPILVATGSLARLGSESLKQQQYGNLDVPLFATLDEALAFARAELGN